MSQLNSYQQPLVIIIDEDAGGVDLDSPSRDGGRPPAAIIENENDPPRPPTSKRPRSASTDKEQTMTYPCKKRQV